MTQLLNWATCSFTRFMSGFLLSHDTPTVTELRKISGFTTEAPYIAEKRQQAIAYLRSFTPSKYVLDGAKVDFRGPTILVKKND